MIVWACEPGDLQNSSAGVSWIVMLVFSFLVVSFLVAVAFALVEVDFVVAMSGSFLVCTVFLPLVCWS